VLAALYGGLVGTLYLAQDHLLYPAAGQPVASIAADVAGYETLRLDTPDGERLVAWWKAPEVGKLTILYFPGNDDPSNTRRERARLSPTRLMIIMSFSCHDSMKMNPEGLRLGSPCITSVAMIQGLHHTAQLCKAFEAANGGVARVDPAI
jgi:hypothetical protein